MNEQNNSKARGVLKNNIYLTLATTDGNAPWASPVFYCLDDEYNFYFISKIDSVHIKNIMHNPNVSFAVFDSTQAEGEGNGVQGNGVVELLEGSAVKEGLNYYSTSFMELSAEILQKPNPYRLFKLKTDKKCTFLMTVTKRIIEWRCI